VNRVFDAIFYGLRFVGMLAATMFVLGYVYGSFPLVAEKMCKQTWINRMTR
jgi:hypothetical protein